MPFSYLHLNGLALHSWETLSLEKKNFFFTPQQMNHFNKTTKCFPFLLFLPFSLLTSQPSSGGQPTFTHHKAPLETSVSSFHKTTLVVYSAPVTVIARLQSTRFLFSSFPCFYFPRAFSSSSAQRYLKLATFTTKVYRTLSVSSSF